ncbi:MAG TPA: cytochrome c biogenesis protein CcsA [Opitutaceae bacterium]|nr:cytochrome c biogenesis protein CcsA [Opitutaceae bacterium]
MATSFASSPSTPRASNQGTPPTETSGRFRWILPLLVLLLCGGYLLAPLFKKQKSEDFDLDGFARLPVLVNGRLKPLDTVARTSLLVLQERQRVASPTEGTLVSSPTEWLLDVLFRPEVADTYPTFAIDNPDLQALLGFTEEALKINYTSTATRVLAAVGFIPGHYKRFSYQQLESKLPEIDRQARLADPVEEQLRNPFQKAVAKLRDRLVLYNRLKQSLVPPGSTDPLRDYTEFLNGIPAGAAAIRAREQQQPHDETAARATLTAAQRYEFMGRMGYLLAIPPLSSSLDPTAWKTTGNALLETFQTGQINPTVMAYGGMAYAWRLKQIDQFNTVVKLYRNVLSGRFADRLTKSDAETRFNAAEPFFRSMYLYIWALLVGVFSWLKWPTTLNRVGFVLLSLAWVASTIGIGVRMWLEGRPPVTNLYSSALFVGWGAVGLCVLLEKLYKNGLGLVSGGLIGFATLLIAHHLSLSGDTLEMMRAVLDSNFWLATHVIVVTMGYSATYLAGFLGVLYVVRGVFTRTLDLKTEDSFKRMVYGILCFATLFSLVGTVLGGIWADQSWGRFWGWDPKENGALIIVLWNALILHARWGGLVKTRGLMALAIFGNVVTSWSWFGTNMLGVGLHSYGFMDAAFYWLVAFGLTQLALIGVALIPTRAWRSYRARSA